MRNALGRREVAALAALCAMLMVYGCGEEKPQSVAAAPVTSGQVSSTPAGQPVANTGSPAKGKESSDPADSLVISAPLTVEHQVEIVAQRDGVIAKIDTQTGARVKSGALLAQLDDRQITANLEAARAKTRGVANDLRNWQAESEVMQSDYSRAQKMAKEGLIPEEQLQHAKFKAESEQWDIKRVTEMLNTSRQEERSLELELEKTRVTAPFSCLVARRYAREGQAVNHGDKLFWVTAEAPLLLRFTLPEKFLGRVKIGQHVELTSPDAPGERHAVRIKEVSSVVDPASGTFDVLAELDGGGGALRPGMTANVRFENPR